jgi:hypothetical protein
MSKITKILFLSLVAFLSTSLVFTSCKKEEDEVVVVEKTPTEKLIGTWKPNKNYVDGKEEELDEDEKNSRLIFLTSSTGKFTSVDEPEQLFEWVFLENNTKIRVTFNESGFLFSVDFTVKRLTETELWIESNFDGEVEEQQFIKE